MLATAVEAQKRQTVQQELNSFRETETAKINAVLHGLTQQKGKLAETVRDLKISVDEWQDKQNVAADRARTTQQELEGLEAKVRDSKTVIHEQGLEIRQLTAKIVDLDSEAQNIRTETNTLKSEFAAQKASLEGINANIATAKEELDGLEADYQSRRARLEDELKTILIRTGDAVTRLTELEARGTEERNSIAADRLALHRERETLERQKAKYSDIEARVLKYKQMMKL